MPDDPPVAAGDAPSPEERESSSDGQAASLADVVRLSADLVRLSVGAVSRRLGVASPTLRTWDRRYGLGPSGRAEGSHRRYTSADVARLSLMGHLVRSGIAPSEAARVALMTPADQLVEPAPPDAQDPGRTPRRLTGVPPVGEVKTPPAAGRGVDMSEEEVERLANEFVLPVPDRSAPESGIQGSFSGETYRSSSHVAGSPAPRVSTGARVLARALLGLDATSITAIVTDAVGRQGVVGAWESLIAPALRVVGRRWEQEQGGGVEIEHVFVECVVSVLRRRSLELAGEPANASPVLLACAPDDQHSLPLHALAAALAERRIACVVLGARVPAAALANAVTRADPGVVFVWSQMASTAALDVVSLDAGESSMRIVAGGPGWDPAELPTQVLAVTEFGRAVELLTTLAL